jgi:hypothetical protein
MSATQVIGGNTSREGTPVEVLAAVATFVAFCGKGANYGVPNYFKVR